MTTAYWEVICYYHQSAHRQCTTKIYHTLYINTQCISLFVAEGTAFDASFAFTAFPAKGTWCLLFRHISLPHFTVLLLLVAKMSYV